MKAAVEHVEQEYAFSQRRACGLLMVAVSSIRYQVRNRDEELRARLVELAREKPHRVLTSVATRRFDPYAAVVRMMRNGGTA